MAVTERQVNAAANAVIAMAEAIKALGSVPSGHFYARLMGKLSLDQYNALINVLLSTGDVKLENHLLTWIGD